MEVSIEEELWNVYSYSALHANPRDPSRLSANALLKLCKDTWVFEGSMTEKAVTPAEVQLIFKAELASPTKATPGAGGRGAARSSSEKSDRLDYDEFLSTLISIAQRCYPSSSSPEEAMQQLLMDNILPLAPRRKPTDVSSLLKTAPVYELFKYYEDALLQLFRFYATSSVKSASARTMIKTTSGAGNKSFDEHASVSASNNGPSSSSSSSSYFTNKKSGSAANENSLANSIGYADFVKFSSDFGLQSSMGLTILDLGDIYLSVIQMGNFETRLRKMTFREFCEALLRSALTAFKDVAGLSVELKLKSTFLYMWRHIQQSVQDQINSSASSGGGGLNTYKGGLIRGAQILNEKFISAWEKDGYKDYLDTAPVAPTFNSSASKASSMLNKLITRSKDALSSSGLNASRLDERDAASASLGVGSGSGGGAARRIIVDIDDDADLGDDRIKPSALRLLLQNRPDIASLLHACVLEEGLESSEKVFHDCKLTSGRNFVQVPKDNPLGGISIGLHVSGTGVPPGVTVVAVDFERSTLTLSSVVALSGNFTLTFTTA